MNNKKITEMSKISFDNFISISGLLNEHNAIELSIVDRLSGNAYIYGNAVYHDRNGKYQSADMGLCV